LNELISMAHRIVVMRRGRLVADIQRKDFDVRKILSISSSEQVEEQAVRG